MSKRETKPGAIDIASRRKLLNKLAGGNVVFDLEQESPTEVKYWIKTGSTWLDAIICRGKLAGIPGGKITEIAGLQSVGKSYMALQIATNAQKDLGMTVVYADPESGMSPDFMRNAGCDLSELIYVQPPDLETWYEIIEEVLKNRAEGERFLFILDSLASCPCKSDIEGDYNPNSSVGVAARIQSKALKKLNMPLAAAESTYIILNQLKTNISELSKMSQPKFATDSQRYVAPGGKSAEYFASLRIWLTGSTSKKLKVLDENGYRVGSYVKARLEKSRFGSQDRICEFKILWGEEVGVMDEESIFEAVKPAKEFQLGTWNYFRPEGDKEWKWQGAEVGFVKLMSEDTEFKSEVMKILDRDIIMAFEKKIANSSNFYDPEPEELMAKEKAAKEALEEKENQ